ncbi:MAG: SAM-dependent DNA methyltransferase [Pseudomonadota bacterium]
MAEPIPSNCRLSPAGELDYYPTPPWATRALIEALRARGLLIGKSVWEPACGEGYMARPLAEAFETVRATDIFDYSAAFPEQDGIVDFLLDWPDPDAPPASDWIFTNPPFNRSLEFAELALRRARLGVAFFVKVQWLEGITRHRRIFSRHTPRLILHFAERVPLVKARMDPEARTNQAYIWIVWIKRPLAELAGEALPLPPETGWIAPSRATLERPADYPASPPIPGPDGPLTARMAGPASEVRS